jgi:hypothetical protein
MTKTIRIALGDDLAEGREKIFEGLGAGNVDGGFFQEIHRLDVVL